VTPAIKRQKHADPGLDVVTIERGALTELAVTVRPLADEPLPAVFDRLARVLAERQADIVRMDVFGDCTACPDGLAALASACGEVTWPVTWLQGRSCTDQALSGVQIHAVAGVDVQTFTLDGRPAVRSFRDAHATYAFLGELGPRDVHASPPDQARQTFEHLEAGLARVGMDLSHLVRTWFFNSDILSWYDAFNGVRSAFFTERGVFDGVVPASTGIGCDNPRGAALVAGALAVQPLDGTVRVEAVVSPLQCPALDYGSSFSRAVEVATPDHRRLYVSGTASIAPGGQTVHVGDMGRQAALTMKVVDAILESRGMSEHDVSRGTAYIKPSMASEAVDALPAAVRRPGPMPVIVTQADVCRDDLLFEFEADGIAAL